MSNTNPNTQLIKLYLDKNITEAQFITKITLENKTLIIVLDYPKDAKIDQISLSKQIKNSLLSNFQDLEDIKIIYTTSVTAHKTKKSIPHVKKIILTASAKGGVGKSTIAANISIALAKLGYSVGLVDADIYGPTIPIILGIDQKPDIHEGKMIPIKKHGIHSISIGYLVQDTQAAIWRGPMISKALYQLLLGVEWPLLDYLIIDMPPGTGDIYLSLVENFLIDGALLITTPQKIALNILKKSISFFNKTNIPIIGTIENMSYFYDSENKKSYNIFGSALDQDNFKNLGAELLGQIPFAPIINSFSEKGLNLEKEPEFIIFSDIAKKICNPS